MDIQLIFKNRALMKQRRGYLKFPVEDHAELEKGEVYLCNANEMMWDVIDLETKRRGKTARSYDGKEFGDKSFFPVFVKEAELRRRKINHKVRFEP